MEGTKSFTAWVVIGQSHGQKRHYTWHGMLKYIYTQHYSKKGQKGFSIREKEGKISLNGDIKRWFAPIIIKSRFLFSYIRLKFAFKMFNEIMKTKIEK